MKIIVEGPDNSGKSTLAAFLSRRLSLPIIKSPGPCANKGDMIERYWQYRMTPAIYDRFALISEGVYSRALRRQCFPHRELIDRFYFDDPVIVYCENIAGLTGHIADSRADTAEHLSAIENNHWRIVAEYDNWARYHHPIRYKFGVTKEKVLMRIRGRRDDDTSRTIERVRAAMRNG